MAITLKANQVHKIDIYPKDGQGRPFEKTRAAVLVSTGSCLLIMAKNILLNKGFRLFLER